MRATNDLLPLVRRKLVAREHMPNLVIQNFGGCPRQSAQAVVAQHAKIVSQRHACEFHTIDNFHRRKGMNVHARNNSLHCSQNVSIIKSWQAMRQSALNANLGCTQLPGLDRLLRNLVGLEKVRVGFARSATERTELAPHETNISEVDVSIDDVSNDVTREFAS